MRLIGIAAALAVALFAGLGVAAAGPDSGDVSTSANGSRVHLVLLCDEAEVSPAWTGDSSTNRHRCRID